MDRSTECSEHDSTSHEYSITYHFDFIRTDLNFEPAGKKDTEDDDNKRRLTESEDGDMAHPPLSTLMVCEVISKRNAKKSKVSVKVWNLSNKDISVTFGM